MSRNVLVAIVAMLVFVVVAGAVYLELATSSGARDLVWEVSRSVTSGELLTADNVQQLRIPHAGHTPPPGESFDALRRCPE